MKKCLTDGKTDDILVNCITMLATVPFFGLTHISGGVRSPKNGVLLRSGTNKNKRQEKEPAYGGAPAAENLNGVIVH